MLQIKIRKPQDGTCAGVVVDFSSTVDSAIKRVADCSGIPDDLVAITYCGIELERSRRFDEYRGIREAREEPVAVVRGTYLLCELLTGERQPLWCSPEGRQAWLKALHESSGAGAEYLHQSQPLTFEALGRLVHGSVIQMAVTCLSPDGAAKAVVRYAAPGLMLNVLRADTLEPICTVIDDKAAVPPGAAVQVAFMQILGKQWAVTVLCGDHVATVFMIPGSGWARLSIPGNDSAFSVADRPSAGTSGAAPAEQSLVTSAVQIIDEFFMMPRCPNPDCRVAFAIDFSQSLAVACECCNSYFCVWCNVIYPDSLAAHNCTCFTEGKFPMWAHSAADQEMYRQRHLASVRGGIEVFLQALQRSAAAEVRRRLGF